MSARRLAIRIDVAQRLDLALLDELRRQGATDLSRSKLKQVFRSGGVRFRGRAVGPSHELPPGRYEIDLLLKPDDLSLGSAVSAHPAQAGSFLPVVYEDERLLVLHKFSGVPSAPLSSLETETAVGSALAFDPGLAGVGRGGLEPGLLHRLDTGTSGLLAFARTQEAYQELRQAWKDRRVRKIYRALVQPGSPELKPGIEIRLRLGHDAHSSKRMRVIEETTRPGQVRGKPLETLTRIDRILAPPAEPSRLDVQVEIQTGVMHQIRCTLAHLGAPIIGDPIYGGPSADRLWLHAWRLGLPLPDGGELWVEAALPARWP